MVVDMSRIGGPGNAATAGGGPRAGIMPIAIFDAEIVNLGLRTANPDQQNGFCKPPAAYLRFMLRLTEI